MATFRAIIQGGRGSASRLGHKNITAHIDGWHLGVAVYGYRNEDGTVEFHIYKTSGSGGAKSDEKIMVLKEDSDEATD